MKTLFVRFIPVLAMAGALQLSTSAHAASDEPTGLECGVGQSLWVYEFGDRGSMAAPNADGGVYNRKFETWELGDQIYWIGTLNDLPGQVSAAKTLEKILLEEGAPENIPLGTFSNTAPFQGAQFRKIGTVVPKSKPGTMSFNLEPSVATLFDPADYQNELTYVVTADAQLEYVRLSLCSDETVPEGSGGTSESTATTESTAGAGANIDALKAEIEELTARNLTLQQEKNKLAAETEEVELLKEKNSNQTDTINYLNTLLKDAPNIITGLETKLLDSEAKVSKLSDEVLKLTEKNKRFKEASRLWKAASGFLGLLSLGLGGLLLFRPRGRLGRNKGLDLKHPNSIESERPSKPIERQEGGGVVFPGSPMQAANVATPLSPAGQLTASNLQMLNGQFQVLRPAYHATGRIGYAQEGKPTSEDYSFGTGFLISPNHVMTNRHVHGFYGHYLTSDEDCGGIEFIAEKDKDASDFIPFNGQPPLLLEGLDIAIYTLSRSAGNRTPINRVPIPTDELEGRDIAVVGYPDTHDPNNPDILAVVEDNPIFAVKRISQGKIFRHSTDNDNPYGVEVNVNETDKKKFPMQAICHNASTLGGNSGSPILDLKTGELLGVHFAGHKIFNQKEAANLAMAIAQLTEHSDIKNV